MAGFRILSLDGGGIRGLITARILERLELEVPGFLAQVDLFAGTSTGGIIALGLAFGLTPTQLVDLYWSKGKMIFDDSWLDDIKDLGGISGAEYNNRKLARVAEEFFGTTRLRDLKRRVLVPSFDLDDEQAKGPVRRWKPKFFHNFPGPDSDGAESVVDVALRTSAAPTYFPSYQGYVDGGVVANNPSMAALAQAIDEDTGAQPLKSLRLLSLGTGVSEQFIKGQSLDWGYAQWVKPLVELMIDGVMGVAHFQCTRLLGGRYHRLDPLLPTRIPLDDTEKLAEMLGVADACDLSKTVAFLQATF
jgi:uncharacterized protein